MDSFDLWGASLCWAEEDAPQRQEANILSTQDIMDHEARSFVGAAGCQASFDCAEKPEAWQTPDTSRPSEELQGSPASSQAP